MSLLIVLICTHECFRNCFLINYVAASRCNKDLDSSHVVNRHLKFTDVGDVFGHGIFHTIPIHF